MALGINRIFGRRGTVFRDRFFSRVLSSVSELVRALRCVGLNPVLAGLCRRPDPDCKLNGAVNQEKIRAVMSQRGVKPKGGALRRLMLFNASLR